MTAKRQVLAASRHFVTLWWRFLKRFLTEQKRHFTHTLFLQLSFSIKILFCLQNIINLYRFQHKLDVKFHILLMHLFCENFFHGSMKWQNSTIKVIKQQVHSCTFFSQIGCYKVTYAHKEKSKGKLNLQDLNNYYDPFICSWTKRGQPRGQ